MVTAELEKTFPGLSTEVYEKGGDMWTFEQRLMMTLQFELLFAGKLCSEKEELKNDN